MAPRREGGDCLYDAVNDALGNQYDNVAAYRDIAHAWFLENVQIYPDLTAVADFDDIVRTLKTPRAWTGDAGDLSPLILASSLNITLEIVSVAAVHVYPPLGDNSVRTVTVYYAADHYTDQPTDLHSQEGPRERIVHQGKAAQPIGLAAEGAEAPQTLATFKPPVYFNRAEIVARLKTQPKDLKKYEVYQDSVTGTGYRYLGVKPSAFTLKTHAFERVDDPV